MSDRKLSLPSMSSTRPNYPSRMAGPSNVTKFVMVVTTFMIVWSLAGYIRNFDQMRPRIDDLSNTSAGDESVFSTAHPAYDSGSTQASPLDTITPELLKTPQIQTKVAVIVEDRPLENLVPLVLHFAAVLGPSWPIFIYTSESTAMNLSEHASLNRWSHQIGIRLLPEGTSFQSHDSVSEFLTKPWLWTSLAPAEHVLLFQADSILCANAPQSVDDFLIYDFVGAPVREEFGAGYNGGLSLRNRRKILDIVTQSNWQEEKGNPGSKWEDQWFYTKMKDRSDMSLPSYDVAKEFAVETIYYERPLGYHQIKRWQEANLPQIEAWCPEIKMTMKATFF